MSHWLTEAALDNLLTDQRSSVRAQRRCVAVIMVLAVLRDRGVYAPPYGEERGRHPSLPIRDDTPRGICEGYQGVTVRLMSDGELSRLDVLRDLD